MIFQNNSIYVFGGQDDDNNKLGDMWQFDIAQEQWTECKAKNAPEPRSGHSVSEYRDQVYYFGGILELTKELNECLCFNAAKNEFTIIDKGNGDGD